MKNTRVVAVVVGLALILPGVGLILGGGSLGLADAFGRDDSGYFQQQTVLVNSSTVAVTTGDLPFVVDSQVPPWVLARFATDVRLRVTATEPSRPVFIGVATTSDLDQYLSGVAHDVLLGTGGPSPTYRSVPGTARVSSPGGQGFWAASASGRATQELTWRPAAGHWALALINADGAPAVAAETSVGIRVGSLLPLALLLLGAGVLLTASGAILLRVGLKRAGDPTSGGPAATASQGLPDTGSQLIAPGTLSGRRNQS